MANRCARVLALRIETTAKTMLFQECVMPEIVLHVRYRVPAARILPCGATWVLFGRSPSRPGLVSAPFCRMILEMSRQRCALVAEVDVPAEELWPRAVVIVPLTMACVAVMSARAAARWLSFGAQCLAVVHAIAR